MSLEIDLNTKSAKWHKLSHTKDEEEFETLNLNESGWQRLMVLVNGD